MGWSFFNDVFRCTERDVPCGAMCAFGTLRIKNVIASVAWQSPGRAPCHKPHARYCIMGPNGILCTRWEKEYASVRQTFVACDDCLVKNEAYDAEEKAHTSKRVSVIAPDNVISKAQFAPCSAILCQIVCLIDTFYGKNKPNPCQRDTFRAFFNYSAIKFLFVAECLSYFRIVEKVVFVQVFFIKRLYVGLCGQHRLFERRFCS